MKRIVSVYLPHWPIERLRREQTRQARISPAGQARANATGSRLPGEPSEAPFALVESGHRGVRLAAVNTAAAALGVHAGDGLADARAILPSLLVSQASPAADRDQLRGLAQWIGRYGIARNAYGLVAESPSGHRVRHYGLWADISGVAHLYGGEASLLADLEQRLVALGLTARLGLADTLGAAHALAWHGRGNPIAPPGDTLNAISSLPAGALRLDQERVHLLGRLGFKQIGALARVPRVALERRFRSAEEGQRVLLRLDQALGLKAEPRRSLVEPPDLSVRAAFADPLITSAVLEGAVSSLAEALCDKLDAAGLGVQSARLALYRTDGSVAEVCVALSRGGREPRHLLHLLAEKLGTLDLGFGVDLATLDATRTTRLPVSQQSMTHGGEGGKAELGAQLVDRLVNRLGAERVFRLKSVASHWPERSEVRERALCPSRDELLPRGDLSVRAGARRPALLLGAPEPICVMAEIPEGAPMRFTWRRVGYRVVRAEGPERIEAEWWRQLWPHPGSRARDYYALEDEAGARFWVYRDGRYDDEADEKPPAWFVHGVFA